jgi:response regulator RpfG family c-di-GMP phosphodiesterase
VDAAKKISTESGKQFDPSVVAAFLKVVRDFDEVRRKYKDELAGIHTSISRR